jgi:putative Mg2+ transporter-C (MgtC) family protein
MEFFTEDFLKIVVALIAGGLIGLERESRDKAAGFRTIILISTGAALFTILSYKLGVDIEHSRIAANIVSGVGFIGAGVIFRGEGKVTGLTTAATIWIAAALGMGSGAGEYELVLMVVLVVFLVLWIFPFAERLIQLFRDHHQYVVSIKLDEELFNKINNLFEEGKLKIRFKTRIKKGDTYICTWDTSGTKKEHDKILDYLLHEEKVIEFDY